MPLDIDASIAAGLSNPAVLLKLSGVTLQLALDALNTYIEPSSWYPPPSDLDAAQNYIDTAAKELMSASMIYSGMLIPYAVSGYVATAPTGWLFCLGSEVAKADYPDLFATIGDAYGSPSNPNNFKLPDLKARTIFGTDTAISGAFKLNTTGGVQTVTLSVNEMPAHSHKIDRGLTSVTAGAVPIITASGIYTQGNTTTVGGGQAFSILNPYIALYWLIKT